VLGKAAAGQPRGCSETGALRCDHPQGPLGPGRAVGAQRPSTARRSGHPQHRHTIDRPALSPGNNPAIGDHHRVVPNINGGHGRIIPSTKQRLKAQRVTIRIGHDSSHADPCDAEGGVSLDDPFQGQCSCGVSSSLVSPSRASPAARNKRTQCRSGRILSTVRHPVAERYVATIWLVATRRRPLLRLCQIPIRLRDDQRLR
jgi:hypothetical protein